MHSDGVVVAELFMGLFRVAQNDQPAPSSFAYTRAVHLIYESHITLFIKYISFRHTQSFHVQLKDGSPSPSINCDL